MNQGDVSVVIPVYNAGLYLRETLESVLGQTIKPKEIILVNDGSTDNSFEQTLDFQPVITWLDSPHVGISHALNLGISKATGKYLAFLDADDIWLPDKLVVQIGMLSQNIEYQGVFGFVEMFGEGEMAKSIQIPERPQPGFLKSCFMVKRSAFDTVGLFNENFQKGEFIDWILRFQDQGFQYLMPNQVLTRRRLHRSGISGSPDFGDFLNMIKARLDRSRAQ